MERFYLLSALGLSTFKSAGSLSKSLTMPDIKINSLAKFRCKVSISALKISCMVGVSGESMQKFIGETPVRGAFIYFLRQYYVARFQYF